MKIGIDGRFLGPEGTGIGKYIELLLENLEKIDSENQYVIFLRKENINLYYPKSPNFKKVLAPVKWYSVKEQLLLPPIFLKERLDLLHVPHFNIPALYPGKMIVTIHDLIKSEFASLAATTRLPLVYWVKHVGYEAVLRTAVRRAKKIIVPSGFVKEKLIKKLKVKKGKIEVIYEAADPFFLEQAKIPQSEGNIRSTLFRYGIKKPYLLYVGNCYPYKNLENLISALKYLDPNLRLVVVSLRSVFHERLLNFTKKEGLESRITFTGFVAKEDLVSLYKEAESFVFPSLSEGFGIPGLDAMDSSCPLICSNISTFREVYQDAALYFDHKNPGDIAQKIDKMIKDERLREELIKRGKSKLKNIPGKRLLQRL